MPVLMSCPVPPIPPLCTTDALPVMSNVPLAPEMVVARFIEVLPVTRSVPPWKVRAPAAPPSLPSSAICRTPYGEDDAAGVAVRKPSQDHGSRTCLGEGTAASGRCHPR